MEIEKYVICENLSILETMKIINERAGANLFICREGILKATVSDGDIRRYIIKNGNLSKSISEIANYNPIYAKQSDNIDYNIIMENHGIMALPIVDDSHRLVSIKFIREKKEKKKEALKLPVVIMAGGKGTRLHPYTQILPKPLIPIGNQTITEHIMERFEQYQCSHFDMIINYKKNFIRSYFQDNEIKRNVDFIEEPEFWGTAGGLKLLEGKYKSTFFVSNCDVLIDADYKDIYNVHKQEKNIITLVCAKKKIVIPYGTVSVNEKNEILEFKEKPEYTFLTNTGLYLVEPEFLKMIPEQTFIHITDVIQKCMNAKKKVGTYIIDEENFMDMGQLRELEQMREKLK